MALIPKFHLIPESFPVKAAEEIIAGMVVALDAVANNGQVVVADQGALANVYVGLAGDTKSATGTSGLPFVGGGTGAGFQNRVSDNFDETKASGLITVYHSGGTFATNMYVTGTYTVGDNLYVGTTVNKGKLGNTMAVGAVGAVVGIVTKVPGAYDSGVPGIDVNGSITLGNYMEFILKI
jgi:hypothetical protein